MATGPEIGNRSSGWYYGWNVVAVCVLAGIAANALPINAFSLFLGEWTAQLHVPVSTLQIGIGACGLGCAIFSPIAGILADKYSGRWLFGIGLVGMVLFSFGISWVTRVWEFIALYALVLPVSLLLSTAILANAVVSRWFVRRLGLALSITAFGLGMAGVVMPPIVAATMPTIGWRGIWRIGGLVTALIILPLVIAVLRDRPTERDGLRYLTPESGRAPAHGSGVAGALRWRDIFARRNFWLLIAVYVPMLALYGGCGNNIAPLATSRGSSQQTAGVLLSLLNLSQLGATLIAGLLSDRFGNRVPLAGLAFATALGGVLVAFGSSAAVLGLGVILAACGASFWPLIAAAIAAEFGASAVGRVFGLVIFFLPLTVVSPFAVAKTHETTGSYAPALLVMTVLSLAGGAACLLWMRERRDRSTAPPDVAAAKDSGHTLA
jgi:MFS family permease